MLTFHQAKPAFQARLRPLAHWLAQRHISPNSITSAAVLLSGGMGGAIALVPQASWTLRLFPGIVLTRMALNAIDGMVAREYDQATLLGAVLNELGDVIADLALYLPWCLIPGVEPVWIAAIVILIGLSEMAGVLGAEIAHHRCYDGPMGKSDRAFVFSVLALLLGWGIAPGPWLTGVWIVMITLQVWTVINRVGTTLREAQSLPETLS